MSRVIGRKRNVSGKTTPKDCLKLAPSIIAKPAIKLLPKSQLVKLVFSSVSRKYGRTATAKSVKNKKMLSKLKEKNVRPNSTARKKRTNDVSTAKPRSEMFSSCALRWRDIGFIISYILKVTAISIFLTFISRPVC